MLVDIKTNKDEISNLLIRINHLSFVRQNNGWKILVIIILKPLKVSMNILFTGPNTIFHL